MNKNINNRSGGFTPAGIIHFFLVIIKFNLSELMQKRLRLRCKNAKCVARNVLYTASLDK